MHVHELLPCDQDTDSDLDEAEGLQEEQGPEKTQHDDNIDNMIALVDVLQTLGVEPEVATGFASSIS